MPSVTDAQQQQSSSSTATHGKATPPPQQTSSSAAAAAAATTAAAGDADLLTQAILLLDKKQRNLGKRKEKLETYQQEAKTGKELHKDQTEALAKYPEVLGQIECVKELSEQLKKLQVESARNQKRLSKQAAEEKRQLVSQRLREYARLRYLLDHRPATLKPEDGKLLDELAAVITPTENSLASISRSIDTVLGIYQANTSSAPIKHLPGRSAQEVRDALEQLLQSSEPQATPTPTSAPAPAPTVSAPELVPVKAAEETNDVQPTSDDDTSNKPTQLSEYPFQLDTRTQDISVEQIIQNSQFLSNDSPTPSQDNDNEQALDQNQYLQPFTVVNSNQQTSPAAAEHQHAGNAAHPVDMHDQHAEGQWQQPRGNAQRGGQHTEGNGSRSFHRGRPNHYNQAYRGPRGGGYENTYGSGGGGQRPYHENSRGRGGPNPNYRGNRGGNYRGGNRGYYNNSNNGEGYHNAGQQQQVRSAPPSSTQHQ